MSPEIIIASIYIYLLYCLFFAGIIHMVNCDLLPEGPITYYYILFYIFVPIPFSYFIVRSIFRFIIQVHRNSVGHKPKPKHTTFSKAINSMHEYRDNMRLLKKKRPIPEILEELDEAVDNREDICTQTQEN